jgi:hypothetical protein
MTADVDASRAFYTELFGWTAAEPSEEFGGYFMFMKSDIPVAGCVGAMPDQSAPTEWSVYLAADDARITATDVVAEGGEILVPAMDVADLGTMAVVADPTGAKIGIWEPKTFQGIGILAETGTPTWFELFTRNYPAALDFYRDVFHWQIDVMSDTPEFRYATLMPEDGPLAGIMDASGFLPDGVPASWSVYFAVDDVDASLAKVTELGGSILQPARDTPYGRLATASDTTGATFNLMAPR